MSSSGTLLTILLALLGVHAWHGDHRHAAADVVNPPVHVRPLREYGCTQCHRYRGTGTTNLGAPDLSHEGRRSRGVRWQVRHLRCPSCLVPGSPMPSFRSLPPNLLRALAKRLEASR